MGELARTVQPTVFLAGAEKPAAPGAFPERSESVTVRPSAPPSGAVPPPERSESLTVRPSPTPR
jgi:hypothetical protein